MGNPQRSEVALMYRRLMSRMRPYTPALLDVLSRHGARVTFFNCGTQFVANPHLGMAMASAGHHIGAARLLSQAVSASRARSIRAAIGLTCNT